MKKRRKRKKKLPREIERRFKVKEVPKKLSRFSSHEIAQGYFRGRLRKKDGKYFITIKIGKGVARPELEGRISKKLFKKLWPGTNGISLEKTRYDVPVPGPVKKGIAELDAFKGRLKGYHQVEVEFNNLKACRRFTPPPWFGEEVTDNPLYNNAELAKHGLPSRKKRTRAA